MVEYSLYVNQLHLHFELGKLLRILPISVHVNVLSVLCCTFLNAWTGGWSVLLSGPVISTLPLNSDNTCRQHMPPEDRAPAREEENPVRCLMQRFSSPLVIKLDQVIHYTDSNPHLLQCCITGAT